MSNTTAAQNSPKSVMPKKLMGIARRRGKAIKDVIVAGNRLTAFASVAAAGWMSALGQPLLQVGEHAAGVGFVEELVIEAVVPV